MLHIVRPVMLSQILDFVASSPWLILAFLCLVLIPDYLFYKLFLEGVVPRDIPWAGNSGTGLVAQIRSTLSATFNMKTMLLEEYQKNRPFMTAAFHHGPMLVLTRDHVKWYNTQLARGKIDFGELMKKQMHMEYNGIGFFDVNANDYLKILHRVLTRSTLSGLNQLREEVQETLHRQLTSCGEKANQGLKETKCHALIERLTSASANRLLLGPPICYDEVYLDAATTEAKLLSGIAFILHATPRLLQPVVGACLNLISKYHWRILTNRITPTLLSMLETTSDSSGPSEPEPTTDTFISKFIHQVRSLPKSTHLLNLEALQTLVGVVNVAALSTTSLTTTDLILHILSHPAHASIISRIRAEASALFSHDAITVDALDRMTFTDGLCRETLRLDNGDMFFTRGEAMEDLWTKDGVFIPKGTSVALPTYGIHRDGEIYGPESGTWEPERFSGGKDKGEGGKERQPLTHEVSERFLAFALGPHACPGRWFGVAQMKIILAVLFLKYDVEPLKEVPVKRRLGAYTLPPSGQTIWLKERKGSMTAETLH